MTRHTEDQVERYISLAGRAIQVLARLAEVIAEIARVRW